MTKNKEQLTWRLKERPSAEGVSKLVEQGIISKEEGRKLLFDKLEYNEVEIKALKEQIEFLKGVVDTLSKNRSTITTVPYTYTIKTPRRFWDNIDVWCKSSGNIMMSSATSYSGGKNKEEWTLTSGVS